MQRNLGIVVVGASHGSYLFAHLVVIVGQRVDLTRIGVRQLCREVGIASHQVCKRIGTVVAWKQNVDDTLCQRLDVGNQTWTAFVEHEDDGLACLCQSLHEVALVLAQPKVGEVTRSLAVAVLANAGHDDIDATGSSHSLFDAWRKFVIVGTGLVVFDALLEDNVLRTELVAECLVDGVVLLSHLLDVRTLPGVAPAAIEAAHLVGIRSGQQDTDALLEREDAAFVLEQDLAFLSRMEGLLGKLVTSELLITFATGVGVIEETETILHAKHAASGIIDARHGHLAFLNQFLQQYAELHAVGVHAHIDTGVDGDADGILLVLGNPFALIEVVDVGPVGHDHTVPLQVFLQPLGEVLVACVYGHAVDRSGIDHNGEGARLDGILEGLEILLTQHGRGEVGRSAVLAGEGSTIGEVMLHARCHMVLAEVVGIVALITCNLGLNHTRIDDGIFAETFPDTRPTRITTQVEHRIIHPGAVGRTALVGGDFGHLLGQGDVERSAEVDGLREECAALHVGHAVVVVKAIDVGDAEVLHRLRLDLRNPALPLLHRTGLSRGIEHRTHLPFADGGVEHGLVEFPRTLGVAREDVEAIAAHTLHDLFIGELQHFGHSLFALSELKQCLAKFIAVNLRILKLHATQDVEIEFEHLTDLLIE